MVSVNRQSLTQGPMGWIASLVAGAITPLAFAPFEFSLLIIPALMLLFHQWLNMAPKAAFTSGYLFGLGMFGVGCSWVFVSMYHYGGLGLFGSAAMTLLFVAFLALYTAVAGLLVARLRQHAIHPWQALLLLPSAWAGYELFRGWFLTGFPWLNSGVSQLQLPLAGYAPLLGVYGISWLLALSAALLLFWCYQRQIGWRYGMVLIVIWVAGAALQKIEWSEPLGEPLQVSAMQGNVPLEIKWQPQQQSENFYLYTALTEQHWESDLVVWPETAMTRFLHQLEGKIDDFWAEARSHDTAIITGVPVFDQQQRAFYNAVVAYDEQQSLYYKRHLVPFGEYIPFEASIGRVLEFMNIPMSSFHSGGEDQPALRVAGIDVGASICYEVAFAEEMIQSLPTANLLVNVSNDTWFDGSLAPFQHLQMARMRALESERWIVRATNTGISAIIDQDGVIRQQSPQNQIYVVSDKVQPLTGTTPYVVWGNWPIWALVCIVLSGFALLSYRRKTTQAGC